MTYLSSNKKVATVSSGGKVTIKGYGKAKITIRASETEEYKSAKKTVTIKVVPQKAVIQKVIRPNKSQVRFTWKKDKSITGYQMQVSTRKSFNGSKGKTFRNSKNQIVLNLHSGKKYYVRIRFYKKVGTTKYYGAWSKVKKI